MNKSESRLASRRSILRAGLASGAAALTGPALAEPAKSNPASLPPNVADWTRMLGEGVAARPYGKRAKY
jgi:sulfane dehydrogenase subunit SoxC